MAKAIDPCGLFVTIKVLLIIYIPDLSVVLTILYT